ncbi:MAG: hypothetical protein KatS3mg076_1713 [Candidatus Binatia bacterium]|nr:MAG: hypothetical protein KatS3mg076_1713 [Candidatus Binatia bacterium]
MEKARVTWFLAAVGGALALFAGTPESSAQARHGLDRPGFSVGLGATVGLPDFDLDSFEARAGEGMEQNESFGFDVRAGYRLARSLAVEANFQYHDEFGIDFDGGGKAAEANIWTLTANLKPYFVPDAEPLSGRLQVYGVVGGGLVWAEVDGFRGGVGIARDELEFVGRFGAGADVYMTDRIALFGEYVYHLPTEDLVDFRFGSTAFGVRFVFPSG